VCGKGGENCKHGKRVGEAKSESGGRGKRCKEDVETAVTPDTKIPLKSNIGSLITTS